MLNNRVYIASKLGRMETEVKKLRATLEASGFSIIYDWTEYFVPKPFEDHCEEANLAAESMAVAIIHCDILIVLCAEGGIGYHIETGGALVASVILAFITGQKRKKIYVVGEGNNRSVFYFHESVTRVPDIESLIRILGLME